MNVRTLMTDDVVSIERVVVVAAEEADEESMADPEMAPGTYALDSQGRLWRLCEAFTGVLREVTEHDGVRRTRKRRTSR